jgi:hypothetical protein
VVKAATTEARAEVDAVAQFVAEKIEISEGQAVGAEVRAKSN